MGNESGNRKIINHNFVQGQGNPSSCQKIFNVHDSASLVVDCKSLTLGWISLSLYKVVVDSYNLVKRQTSAVPSTVKCEANLVYPFTTFGKENISLLGIQQIHILSKSKALQMDRRTK